MSPICETHDDEKELELAYQRSLTMQQRFEMMFQKSQEMAQTLLRRGYRKPVETIAKEATP